MSEKRKLFTSEEKLNLQQLVLKYEHILENKKCDVLTVLKKKETWKTLALEFNSIPRVTQRDENSLKKCWENMKFLKKKAIAKEKIEKLKSTRKDYKSPTRLDEQSSVPSTSKCAKVTEVGPFIDSEDGILRDESYQDSVSDTTSSKSNVCTACTCRHLAAENELLMSTKESKRMLELEEEFHVRRMKMEEETHEFRMRSYTEIHANKV
ncbi:hypothetical protein RN001_013541 [Aquatica leii]|uniref:Myb/SANT-like DNA-binding domain-containing protein 3 n=1 Tax=Aquatica leii TaxID=1421715 RepID=A0AAN7P2L7_9COLE|nr:hypothetical protein RN001_013541 [Aquatica leii]